jgi:hypothetical protein
MPSMNAAYSKSIKNMFCYLRLLPLQKGQVGAYQHLENGICIVCIVAKRFNGAKEINHLALLYSLISLMKGVKNTS